MPNLKVIFDLENFKCCDCYFYLIKQKYEKPSKWRKLKEEFNQEDKQVLEAYVMPLRVANEPYLRSFQYKVLNSIFYTNELLCKIGYVSTVLSVNIQEKQYLIFFLLFVCYVFLETEVYEHILSKL